MTGSLDLLIAGHRLLVGEHCLPRENRSCFQFTLAIADHPAPELASEPTVARLIEACLAHDRDDRPGSAVAIVDALAPAESIHADPAALPAGDDADDRPR